MYSTSVNILIPKIFGLLTDQNSNFHSRLPLLGCLIKKITNHEVTQLAAQCELL